MFHFNITDIISIINVVKDKCNLIWLENLNLRGDYKAKIINYIKKNNPELINIYYNIYYKGNRSYWEDLDCVIKKYTKENCLKYVRNTDSFTNELYSKPIIVNFFYHEEIKKSAIIKTK